MTLKKLKECYDEFSFVTAVVQLCHFPLDNTEAEYLISRINEATSYEPLFYLFRSLKNNSDKDYNAVLTDIACKVLSFENITSDDLLHLVVNVPSGSEAIVFTALRAYLERSYGFTFPDEETLFKEITKTVLANENSLEMGNWHMCDTTHCLGGWSTFLRSELRSIEKTYGTQVVASAALPNYAHLFYCENEEVLEILRKLI